MNGSNSGISARSFEDGRMRRDLSVSFSPHSDVLRRSDYLVNSMFPSILPAASGAPAIFGGGVANQWPRGSRSWQRLRIARSPFPLFFHEDDMRREAIGHGILGYNESQAPHTSQDNQGRVVDKLRKIVYNPAPKKMARRLCSYYKDRSGKDLEKEDDESGTRCAVCLEDFEAKDVVMMTPCDHMFHEECIVPWVNSNGRCPVCRHTLTSKPAASVAGDSYRGGSPNEDLNRFLLAIEDAFVRGSHFPYPYRSP